MLFEIVFPFPANNKLDQFIPVEKKILEELKKKGVKSQHIAGKSDAGEWCLMYYTSSLSLPKIDLPPNVSIREVKESADTNSSD